MKRRRAASVNAGSTGGKEKRYGLRLVDAACGIINKRHLKISAL